MMDDKEKFLIYSNRQRLKETKRIIHNKNIHNFKKRLGILEIEKEIYAGTNSKSCNLTKFANYVKATNANKQDLQLLYQNEKFRRVNWYRHINKKRSEAKLLNRIENIFGQKNEKGKVTKKPVLFLGDWEQGKQMRNFISTPNKGIRRLLQTRFEVIKVDEFRTSCLHHGTGERCWNMKIKDKDGIKREKHSIFLYKMKKI